MKFQYTNIKEEAVKLKNKLNDGVIDIDSANLIIKLLLSEIKCPSKTAQRLIDIFNDNYALFETLTSESVSFDFIDFIHQFRFVNGIESVLTYTKKEISLWCKSDTKEQKILENIFLSNKFDTTEIIIRLKESNIDYFKYFRKFEGNKAAFKSIIKILDRFNVSVDLLQFNSFQIETLASKLKVLTNLDIINKNMSTFDIEVICDAGADGFSNDLILKAFNKFRDYEIVSNYFQVMTIMSKPISHLQKAIAISNLINNHIIKIVLSSTSEDECICRLRTYLDENYRLYNMEQCLEMAVKDMSKKVPFMHKAIIQTKKIFNILSDEIDDRLHELSKKEFKKREKSKEERKTKKKEEVLPVAIATINVYLEEVEENIFLSSKEFCARHSIPLSSFQKYSKLVKENNTKLYERYAAVSKANSVRAMHTIKKCADEVSKGLRDNKDFSLYDYFTICKFDFKVIHHSLETTPGVFKADINRFRRFWEKYRDLYNVNPGWIYNDRMIIGGVEITKTDKDKIIRYMERKRYPFYVPIYKEIVRKYIKKELEL